MYPELFGGIRSYAAFLVIGDLVGFAVALEAGRRSGIGFRRLLPALIIVTVVAFAGAKLFSAVMRGSLGAPAAELTGGYRYPGAVVALVGFLLLAGPILPVAPLKLADVIAPAFAFGMAVTRVGCFLAGCCSGALCRLPWAVTFPPASQAWGAQAGAGLIDLHAASTLPAHPLQAYFGLYSVLGGVFVWWLLPRKHYDGQVFAAFVAIEGIGKFFLEFLRFNPSPEVQYASVALGLAALFLLMRKSQWRHGRRGALS